MDINDLNINGRIDYRNALLMLYSGQEKLTDDALLAVLELLNERVSELVLDIHHGKSPRLGLWKLLKEAGVDLPAPDGREA